MRKHAALCAAGRKCRGCFTAPVSSRYQGNVHSSSASLKIKPADIAHSNLRSACETMRYENVVDKIYITR